MTTMTRPDWILAADHAPGSDDVTVIAVGEREDLRARRMAPHHVVLPVHYRRDTAAPRAGDRLGTWTDDGTRYALAVRS